ncbi:MAG: o-succinylbenzoate--CoA ligase [Anaerolineae bacterium]|nr:o-succinylbenzoate--CoA ligase [Anaerolineae bacterium]
MDWLKMSALQRPNHPAVVLPDAEVSYIELDMLVNSALPRLIAQGIRPYQRVGLLLSSGLEYVVYIHALRRMNAVVVPLNTRLSASELAYQQQFCDQVISGSTLGLKAETGVFSNDYANLSLNQPSQPFACLFTSGTSGKPKLAELSLGALYHSAIASALRIGHTPDDRWLCTLPLYHIGGLSIIMRAALYGITVVLLPSFDIAQVNHALDHQAVTLASFVPTMVYRLIASRTTPPPHLRLVLLGGAAATPDLVQRAEAAGFPIATTYGLTEAASQVCTQLPAQTRLKPASVGKPLPFAQIRVLDDAGGEAPTGQVGAIHVNTPTLMTRYVDNPEATAKAINDGWLDTGDLGYLDPEGDLFIVQRRSDLIVSGGENVYPAEVEAALKQHPSIADAAVVGLPHPEWGQQVAAVLVLQPTATLDIQALDVFLRQSLAGYKLPRRYRTLEALPQTASGKIERRALPALFKD